MKTISFFCSIMLPLLIIGCNGSSEPLADLKDKVIDLNVIDTLSYKYLPLETTEISIIGRVDQILFDTGYIFILDETEAKAIFIFKDDGKFISKISREGRGPGEYTRNIEMDLDRQRKEIVLYSIGRKRLLRFNYLGDYLYENSLPDFMGENFCYLGDDKYAFYGGLETSSTHYLHVTDSIGALLEKFCQVNQTYAGMNQSIPHLFFSKTGKNTSFFIPIWSDKLYSISYHGVNEVFDFKFSKYMVSTGSEIKLRSTGESSGKYDYFMRYFVNSVGQFIVYTTYDRFLYQIIGNLNTGSLVAGEMIITNPDDKKRYGFGALNVNNGTFNDYFIKAIDAYSLAKLYPGKFPNLKPTDNPCLFFYKLKI